MHGPVKPSPATRYSGSKKHAAWVGGLALALISTALVVTGKARPEDIGKVYAVDVLVILLCLDLLTRFFTELGALDAAALAVARATRGEPKRIVWGIGMLMFFISAVLNNLAAVFAAAPIFLLILKQLGAGPKASALVLAVVLVDTNLGGASTPIGDFPAIILMASGVISFNSYLTLAFPLCLCSAVIITGIAAALVPALWAQSSAEVEAFGRFAIEALGQRMQFAHPDWKRIALLSATFLAMIFAWALVNPISWPFHYTAIAGAVVACVVVGRRSAGDAFATYDLRTTIFMTITLAGAAAIATATGILDVLAHFLKDSISNPVELLFVVMFATMTAAAIFQAGPAAAAMLPIITVLAEGPLKQYGDWVYVAFGGSICAGSSMFVWSATSGPALMGEAQKVGIEWGIAKYLPYGLAAASLQFVLVALWVAYAVVPGLDLWYTGIGLLLMIGGGVGLVVGRILTSKGSTESDDRRQRELHSFGMGVVKLSIAVEVIGILTKFATWKW